MSPGDECSLSFGVGQDSKSSTHLRHKLILAIRNYDLATVCALLDQGADANARYNGNSSLLHYAVRSGHSGMVDTLLSHGADPNARDSDGYRPLWIAVEDGHDKVADLLLHGGASLYHFDHFERSMLMSFAVRHGLRMTATLLANGVEPGDSRGISPLAEAVGTDRPEMIRLLLANGANPNARYSRRLSENRLPYCGGSKLV